MRIIFQISIFIFAATMLISCTSSNIKESLGLKKKAPDEFMVLSHPSLSMPPDFNLKPPASRQSIDKNKTIKEAKSVIYKSSEETVHTTKTEGESSLLKHAGTDKSDPEIRKVLKEEQEEAEKYSNTEDGKKKEEGFFSKMMNLAPKEKDPLVDADAERERLRKNKEEGKPVTEGEVPVIKREPDSVLQQIIE